MIVAFDVSVAVVDIFGQAAVGYTGTVTFSSTDIAGILAMIRTVGALVGALVEAEALAQSYENEVAASVRGRPKPKV